MLLHILRHILHQAYYGYGIVLIVRIGEVGAQVLHGIVGHEACGNHGIGNFFVAYLYHALTVLIFSYFHLQLVVVTTHNNFRLASLVVHVALLVVPEPALIYGTILKESQLPVAHLVVAPV